MLRIVNVFFKNPDPQIVICQFDIDIFSNEDWKIKVRRTVFNFISTSLSTFWYKINQHIEILLVDNVFLEHLVRDFILFPELDEQPWCDQTDDGVKSTNAGLSLY